MKRKITCFCDNSFEVEVPEEIDLDTGKYLEEIQNGSFFSFTCTACGKVHKPEFPLSVFWPSKNLNFEVLPEQERGEFQRRKKDSAGKETGTLETIIGYPELADRLAVIKDGFDPVAVEAIKYFLHLKADEQYPDDVIDIWYYGNTDNSLEFHIHGIRANEVAVMKIPLSLYHKTLDDYKKSPKSEVFASLKLRNYLSVKNAMIPEALR